MNLHPIAITIRATPEHYLAAFFTKRDFCLDDGTTLEANTPLIAISETIFVLSNPLFDERDNTQVFELPEDLLTFYNYLPLIPYKRKTF